MVAENYTMDRLREPDRRKLVRRALWLTVAIVAIGGGTLIDRIWLRPSAGIDFADLVTAKVERGTFRVQIQGAGVLEPEFERWVTARVEGTVEQISARVGQEITAGTTLVNLVNPELEQAAAASRLSLIEANADHRRQLAELTDRRLAGEARLLEQRANHEEAQQRLDALGELRQEHAVSEIEYNSARIRAELAKNKLDFEHRRFTELKEVLAAEQAASDARLASKEAALKEAERQVGELLVTAESSGTLRELLVEPGQRIGAGAPIARLVDTAALVGIVRVPESYASRVAPGQMAAATILNTEVPGVVTRLDPAVTQGSVNVAIEFADKLPPGARPALSIRAIITVAELHDTLFVRRPLQVLDDSMSEVFRLTGDNQEIDRTSARFGIGTVRDIQVLSGLNEGDTLIVSDVGRLLSEDNITIR